jgi:hypothetical protein
VLDKEFRMPDRPDTTAVEEQLGKELLRNVAAKIVVLERQPEPGAAGTAGADGSGPG